tara:strand:+ start:2065 stop:2490 length:426 start_codon:yes stop_codon:yes gene_type:complete
MSESTVEQTSNQSPQTHVGRVKWFNNRRGYGFLTVLSPESPWSEDSSDNDVFVHQTNIRTGSDVYRTLSTGEYVSFSLSHDNQGKPMAVDVSGVYGGPLQCELERPRGNWAWNNYNSRGGRRGNRRGDDNRQTQGSTQTSE